jgi:hypothetical protein
VGVDDGSPLWIEALPAAFRDWSLEALHTDHCLCACPAVAFRSDGKLDQERVLAAQRPATWVCHLRHSGTESQGHKSSGQFLGKDLLFFYSGNAGVWYSLAGVDVETVPGAYDLRIRVALPGGQVARSVKPVERLAP